MKSSEVQKVFVLMGLGPTDMSKLLQTGRSTVYRWKDGGTDGCNAILLRLLIGGKISIQDIEAAHD